MKYYEIDEQIARRAKEMNSFSDYIEGSATAEYKSLVDDAAALAERQKQKVSAFYHDKIDGLLDAYARRLAKWYNDHNRNRASCPSILICGGGNFPVNKKEKQNARERTLYGEWDEIQGLLTRIESIGTGAIDFADPNARQMLAEKVDSLQKELDSDKAMNAYYRKHKTMQGFEGISEETAKAINERIAGDYSWNKKPAPDWELTSVRNRLKSAQARLAEYDNLHAAQEENAAESATAFEGGYITRNIEENRLQIIFDEKPDEETRQKLKSNGFHWSPRNSAWQRQLTSNAERAAKKVLGL